MRRSIIGLLLTLALSLLIVPCATDAQQPVKLLGRLMLDSGVLHTLYRT